MRNQWGNCAAHLVLAMVLVAVATGGNPVIGSAAPAHTERSAVLQARMPELDRQLLAVQRSAAGFAGGRQRYESWIAGRERAPDTVVAGLHPVGSGSAESAQIVINRAMTQLGIPYAWSGGDAHGPTRGIQDGGAGDSSGDHQKIGFDCSGLMIYAFAPVIGYSLPHHSGSQYTSGPQVPLSGKRPGDMLFWGSNGRIHHVALYIGNEQVIEAPHSGSAVRVTAVRYRGLMPYVTRLV